MCSFLHSRTVFSLCGLSSWTHVLFYYLITIIIFPFTCVVVQFFFGQTDMEVRVPLLSPIFRSFLCVLSNTPVFAAMRLRVSPFLAAFNFIMSLHFLAIYAIRTSRKIFSISAVSRTDILVTFNYSPVHRPHAMNPLRSYSRSPFYFPPGALSGKRRSLPRQSAFVSFLYAMEV